MAISLGIANWRLRQQSPMTRLAAPHPKRTPLWPIVSIVLLLCMPSFFATIAVTVLNVALVSVAAIVVVFTSARIDRRLLIIGATIGIISFLGLVAGTDHDRYEYVKDFWYISNPLLVMLTGFILYRMRPDIASIFRAFIVAGVIVGGWSLRGYAMDPSIILLPAAAIRQLIGAGSSIPILALSILIISTFTLREGLKLNSWAALMIFMFLAVSIVGMFSRTAVALLLVALAAAAGCFVKREWLRIGLPVIVLIFVAQIASSFVDTESAQAAQTFSGKLLRSLQELTVVDQMDLWSINANFRAYETDRVLLQFENTTPTQMLFGQGFGQTVDLGLMMPLIISETGFRGVRHIGIFHNGYMFLLTKVGLVGLILYAGIILYLYLIARSQSDGPAGTTSVATARVFQMAVVSLAVTTYFVGGIFNRDGMFAYLLLVGCLLGHFSNSYSPASGVDPKDRPRKNPIPSAVGPNLSS